MFDAKIKDKRARYRANGTHGLGGPSCMTMLATAALSARDLPIETIEIQRGTTCNIVVVPHLC